MKTLRLVLALFAATLGGLSARADPAPAIAMYGPPAMAPGFACLPYADPSARKGGRLRLAYLGAFDSLNPFNVKALSTAQGLIGHVYQTLMFRTADEPFTLYAQIARTLETDDDRSFATFRLDPRARFSDGTPIDARDVLFSFNLLKAKGRPQQRAAYALVRNAEALDAMTVRFDLTGAGDRELPLTLGLMPVLSRAHVDPESFEDQTLQVPVGSGPYVVSEVRPGQRLVLTRDPGYWGRDLPISCGMYNFDRIEIDYYRDANAMYEAFKAGLYDLRVEDDPGRWLNGYDFPAMRDGRLQRAPLANRLPKGLTGFVFNTRRALFRQLRVREALAGLFDFDWINANLYGGAYRRTRGLFDDSDLSAAGRPATAKERDLLAPFSATLPEGALAGDWAPPASDGSGRDRKLARRAVDLLAAEGWRIENGALRDAAGNPFAFEILVRNRAEERLALVYARSLGRVGAQARVRLVDEVQFQRRRNQFDFDMTVGQWTGTPSPGAEERTRWGSSSADTEGSFNLAGVRSPAVDAAISALLSARTAEDHIAAARALDRAVMAGAYVVPFFHAADVWIAFSSRLARPPRDPLFGFEYDTWQARP